MVARTALEELKARAFVTIEGRRVWTRAWQFPVVGWTGHVVPVHLLDTDLPETRCSTGR